MERSVLGNVKCEIETLASVESRVAHRLVAIVELAVEDLVGTTDAFGDVVAGELDVDAARPGAFGSVCPDEPVDLGADVIEVASLATRLRGEGVGVHRVARPDDWMTGVAHGAEQRPQGVFDVIGAHAADQREPAGDARRVEFLAQFEHEVGRCGGTDLAADRVADAAQELDVCAVELTSALADPQHVRRAVVPSAAQ